MSNPMRAPARPDATSQVLTFPGTTRGSGTGVNFTKSSENIYAQQISEVIAGAVGNLSSQVTEAIERSMAALIATSEVSRLLFANRNNSYDSIYLQKLEPDSLARHDLPSVVGHAGILDKSSDITFNDSWED